MIALDPIRLIAAASAFVGLGEDYDNRGKHRGPMVELFLREVNQPAGQPWCAAFVHHIGYWSHFDYVTRATSWPLPPTASCSELAEFATRHSIFREDAHPGDVFVLYSKLKRRFVHTGVVVTVHRKVDTAGDKRLIICTTVEGNTNEDGSINGYKTLRKIRRISTMNGDGFIRWCELDHIDKPAAKAA